MASQVPEQPRLRRSAPTSGTRRRRSRVLAGGAVLAAAIVMGAAPAAAIVPGDNGQIAFESSRDGNAEIYVMNPDGTIERNLTNDPASDVFPAWSPDGSQITFSSDRAEPGNSDVYKMNADGSDVTRLTNSPGEDRGTSWTSDGEKIVFHSARDRTPTHAFDVFIMNADGTNQEKLFTNGSAAYVCGNRTTGTIVFNSRADPLKTNPEGDFEIFTMDIDGSNVRQVTDNTVLDSGPKWSPDCSWISYNSLDAGGSLDVFRIDAQGGVPTNLTNAPGVFDAFSAWSPDGERIAFSSNRDEDFEIYTMDATDGGDVSRLTFTGGADLRADWGIAPAYDGPPTAKEQCKQGRWEEFGTPEFSNQGQCVSYVQTAPE